VNRCAIGAFALGLALTGCAGKAPWVASPPRPVPPSALYEVLLGAAAINAVMGTTAMTPHDPATEMSDNRNLLPNLNCLGLWQVDEAAVYGTNGWSAVRRQLLRAPDTDQWDNLVVESVVSYPSADAARDFYTQSSDRWSKCTNHHVNIVLNGQPLPAVATGDLNRTDTELTIPLTRGSGDQSRACQRALAVITNLIIDIEACKPQPSTVTAAAAIVATIESKLPR
jgi:hypothetical protein